MIVENLKVGDVLYGCVQAYQAHDYDHEGVVVVEMKVERLTPRYIFFSRHHWDRLSNRCDRDDAGIRFFELYPTPKEAVEAKMNFFSEEMKKSLKRVKDMASLRDFCRYKVDELNGTPSFPANPPIPKKDPP